MSTTQPTIAIIVAMTAERVIGQAGRLPWSLPEDLQLFRRLTLGGTLIMGRRTYQSLPGPLAGRHNLVISNTMPPQPGIRVCHNWPEARNHAIELQRQIWVIGGADLYREALQDADALSVSWIHRSYLGDVSFPPLWQRDWELTDQTSYPGFTHCLYDRRKQIYNSSRGDAGPLLPPFKV